MNLVLHQYRYDQKQFWREPASVFFTVGLPLIGVIGIPGSELLPTPDAAGVVMVSIFAIYMAGGLGWLVLQRTRRPEMIPQMQSAIENGDLEFAHVREQKTF